MWGGVVWIIVGLIAGWLAARITRSPGGILRNMIIGLVGSIFGGYMFQKVGIYVVPDIWGELITATIGAVVFLSIWNAFQRA